MAELEKTPEIDVNPDIFNDIYREKILGTTARHIYMYGGSSSGKSNFIAHQFVLFALSGEGCMVIRETKVSLRASVWLEIKGAVYDMELEGSFKFNETNLTINCLDSAGSIQLFGCDDEDGIKSIKPMKQAAFTKLWAEECNQIAKNMIIQFNLRMRGKAVDDHDEIIKQTFYSWNPTFESHYLNQDFLKPLGWQETDWFYDDGKNVILRTTYKHNRFLAQEEIDYLEELREISPYHARVYLDALWGVLGERVFENIEIIPRAQVPEGLPVYLGQDFGWTDVAAFSAMAVDEAARKIYLFDGFTAAKQDHIKLSNRIKVILKRYNINLGHPIFCDPEDPLMISNMKLQGLNTRDAKKPAGSVLNGLMIMNTYTIVVVEEFKEAVEAINNYTWVQDKQTKKSTDKPSHTFSHVPDAMRYGLEFILQATIGLMGGRR